jgi:hypothetical protein
MMRIAERLPRKWEAFLPKGGKNQVSGGKYPRIEKPFSKIKKRPDTVEISA